MKTLKVVLLTFALLLISSASHAQFLKKLKKKAAQAIENVVVEKTADKAAEMAGKSMDKIFNIDFNGIQVEPSVLPESYDFEWKYTMQMKDKKGNKNMTYYLKPDSKYFGFQPEMENQVMANEMFMVFDQELDVMAMFMDTESGKMGQLLKSPTVDIEDETEHEANNMEDYTFKEIGTKTILGYECQGFQIENDEIKMIMYVAMNAPVSFNKVYGGHVKTKPKGYDPKWMEKAENSILMEMEIINKKRKKYSTKMTCVALEKSPKTVVVSDYEFMTLDVDVLEED